MRIQEISKLPKNVLNSRNYFDCGEPALDTYLAQTALQHEKKGLAKVFCMTDGNTIIAYYALSLTQLHLDGAVVPLMKKKGLPTGMPLPALRLGRLAVDTKYQRRGIGGKLMVDVFYRTKNVAANVGCIGLIVDAKDEQAAAFYISFGFEAFPEKPLLLYIDISSIRLALANAS